MSTAAASLLVAVVEGYLAAGLLFAIPFVVRGAGRIDPLAREGSWGFRLAVLPGCVALWPWLLWRWRRGGAAPEERNAHRAAAARRTGADAP